MSFCFLEDKRKYFLSNNIFRIDIVKISHFHQKKKNLHLPISLWEFNKCFLTDKINFSLPKFPFDSIKFATSLSLLFYFQSMDLELQVTKKWCFWGRKMNNYKMKTISYGSKLSLYLIWWVTLDAIDLFLLIYWSFLWNPEMPICGSSLKMLANSFVWSQLNTYAFNSICLKLQVGGYIL